MAAVPWTARANSHEHLEYLPSPEDIISGIAESLQQGRPGPPSVSRESLVFNDATLGLDRMLRLSSLERLMLNGTVTETSRRETIRRFLQTLDPSLPVSRPELFSNWPEREHILSDLVSQTLRNHTLHEIFSAVRTASGTPRSDSEYFRALLTVGTHHTGISQYLEAGHTRSFLMGDVLDPDTNIRILRHYVERTPLAERSRLSVSCPTRVPQNEAARAQHLDATTSYLRRVMGVLSTGGAQVDLQLSVGRNLLKGTGEGWVRRRAYLSDLLSRLPNSVGIDITQGIEEAYRPDFSPDRLEVVRSNIEDLFRMAGGRDVRIHAFEGGNAGIFYDALAEALENLARNPGRRPTSIRIGHIAHLDEPRFLPLFQRLRDSGVPVRIEVNPESNRVLQGSTAETIIERIRAAHRAGIPVELGTDGEGVLSRTVLDQLQDLQEYLRSQDLRGPRLNEELQLLDRLRRDTGITEEQWQSFLARRRERLHDHSFQTFCLWMVAGFRHGGAPCSLAEAIRLMNSCHP